MLLENLTEEEQKTINNIFDIKKINKKTFDIWSAIEQSQLNTKKDRIPLLVFSRNRDDIYATIKFEDLLKLIFEK